MAQRTQNSRPFKTPWVIYDGGLFAALRGKPYTHTYIHTYIHIYIYIYIYIFIYIIQETNSWYVNSKIKNRIFLSHAVFHSLCTAKSKNKCDIVIYGFSRNPCFNSWFKNRLQEAFLIKVINTKKDTLHAVNPLIPGGNKRSNILKQAYSF